MSSQFIEAKPELRLILTPAPGERLSSPEFQAELAAFTGGLRELGVEASQKWFTQDAITGGGWGTGEIILAVALGQTAIIELRKLIVAFRKIKKERTVKFKFGASTMTVPVDDVDKVVTREQISKLLEPPKKAARKSGHE